MGSHGAAPPGAPSQGCLLEVIIAIKGDGGEPLTQAGERVNEPGGDAVGVHCEGDQERRAGLRVDREGAHYVGLEKVELFQRESTRQPSLCNRRNSSLFTRVSGLPLGL